MNKIKVGVLGATGAVGQRFVQMLQGHPWFEITALFASERSAGKRYVEACRWNLRGDMPESVREMPVLACEPGPDCQIVFSALPSETAGEIEEEFAAAGYVVCSNARNHRYDEDVPLLIPEVNPEHLKLIEVQKRKRGWSGCIVTNPNCSTTHMISALHPLHIRFGVRKVFVVTMQAVSGAGYPGVSSMDILDNVIPFISGEEEKMELKEPQKLLGLFDGERIRYADIVISAHCNRVPTRNGHLEAISVEFEDRPRIGRPPSHRLIDTPQRPGENPVLVGVEQPLGRKRAPEPDQSLGIDRFGRRKVARRRQETHGRYYSGRRARGASSSPRRPRATGAARCGRVWRDVLCHIRSASVASARLLRATTERGPPTRVAFQRCGNSWRDSPRSRPSRPKHFRAAA